MEAFFMLYLQLIDNKNVIVRSFILSFFLSLLLLFALCRSKRIPKPLGLNLTDRNCYDFVLWSAALRCRSLGINTTVESLKAILDEISADSTSSFLHLNLHPLPAFNADFEANFVQISDLLNNCTRLLSHANEITPLMFDKDESSDGMLDLLTAASNLRCSVYSIRPVSTLEVQTIAGQIIPAIATTTSIVSGLVSLEVMKLVNERILQQRQAKKRKIWTLGLDSLISRVFKRRRPQDSPLSLDKFRNSFVSVADGSFAFSAPMEAERYRLGEDTFTPWDVIEVRTVYLCIYLYLYLLT